MPPKKSKEEQVLAGKQKLEAFKRQKAEAAAAKAAAKNAGSVHQISSGSSNAPAVSEAEAFVPSEPLMAGATESDTRSASDATDEETPKPVSSNPETPSWTATVATPFVPATDGTAGFAPALLHEKNVHPSAIPEAVPTNEPGTDDDHRIWRVTDPPPITDGAVFQTLSTPNSPNRGGGNVAHRDHERIVEKCTANSKENAARLLREIKALRSDLKEAQLQNSQALHDLATSRRASADAAAARARAEGERDAALRRAVASERDALSVDDARSQSKSAAETIGNLQGKLLEMQTSMDALNTTLDSEQAKVLSLETSLADSETAGTQMSNLVAAIETELAIERLARKKLEVTINKSYQETETTLATQKHVWEETWKETQTGYAAKTRAAEVIARQAEDDQLRAEEDAAATRTELAAVRVELAQALFERNKSHINQSVTSEENREVVNTDAYDDERRAFVSEIRGLSRKLEVARGEVHKLNDARNLATRRVSDLAGEVLELRNSLETSLAQNQVLRSKDIGLERAVLDLETRAENAGVSLRVEQSDEADVTPSSESIKAAESSRDEARTEAAAARAELTKAIGQRNDALQTLSQKIKQHNESQDRLLAEIDLRDAELEAADDDVNDATRRALEAERHVEEALVQAREARVRSERLVEIIEEQAVWGEEDAKKEKEEKRQSLVSASAPATPEKCAFAETQKTPSTVPNTPATYSNTINPHESPSVKLAAEILKGTDLGKAYHPLLASIEARLLHLREEKT